MSGFNDGTCPKCGKRFGWSGKVSERPPCPRCNHQLSKEDLDAAERELQQFRDLLDKQLYSEEG